MGSVQFTGTAGGGEPAGTAVVFVGRVTAEAVFYEGVFSPDVFLPGTDRGVIFMSLVEVDSISQLMPGSSAGKYQRVGWRVSRSGVDIGNAVDGNEPIIVLRSLSRPIQNAELSLVRRPGDGLFGALSGLQVTGADPVDVALRYKQSDGEFFSEPLISQGVGEVSDHSLNVPRTVALSVSDRGARHANKLVSYQLAAGSQKTRSQLVRELAVLAGVSTTDMDLPAIGGKVVKAIDIAKGDWLDLAQAHAEVKGARLLWSRDGVFTAEFDAPEAGLPPHSWIIGPDDIVWAINGEVVGINARPAIGPYTHITARGSKQVRRAQCGNTSLVLQTKVFDNFDLNPLSYQQNTNGSFTAISPPATQNTNTTSQTILTLRCDELITEWTKTEAVRNLQRARYTRATDGSIATHHFSYVSDNTDGVPGWVYRNDRRMRDAEINISRLFSPSGTLLQIRSQTWGWYNPRRAFKERSQSSDPWETAAADVSYYELGNGDALVFSQERWMKASETIEKFFVSDGYVTSHVVEEWGFGRKKGTLFLYQDGEWGERQETYQKLSFTRTDYQIVKEGLARRTTYERGVGNENLGTTQETFQGAPPAAEKAEFATARRFEQQEMEATCSLPESPHRLEKVLPSLYWETAETEEELRDICTRFLLQGMATEIEWTVLPNPRIEPGQAVLLVGPPGSGLAHVVLVRDVEFFGSQHGPKSMLLRGLAYPNIAELS